MGNDKVYGFHARFSFSKLFDLQVLLCLQVTGIVRSAIELPRYWKLKVEFKHPASETDLLHSIARAHEIYFLSVELDRK